MANKGELEFETILRLETIQIRSSDILAFCSMQTLLFCNMKSKAMVILIH